MPEEPCQCPDCQRFYREHDRLIRENSSLRQQQEINWAALQSFRTLAGRVLEELQKQHGDAEPTAGETGRSVPPSTSDSPRGTTAASDAPEPDAIQQAMADLENINAHLFSIRSEEHTV